MVYMMLSKRSVDNPPGYADDQWRTTTSTIYMFRSADGYLKAEPLYEWVVCYNTYDWEVADVMHSGSEEASMAAWRERYVPIFGIDYGDQSGMLTIPQRDPEPGTEVVIFS